MRKPESMRPIRSAVGGVLATFLFATMPIAGAQAHSFSLGVSADGSDLPTALDSAIKGILLATRERDSHANETSDGHLGGLDVFLVPLPTEAAADIDGLRDVNRRPIDIAVLLGPGSGDDQDLSQLDPQTVVVRPGRIVSEPTEAGRDFETRFLTAYGLRPDRAAIEGYNAARRVDLALRSTNGVADRPALIDALTATADGIEW